MSVKMESSLTSAPIVSHHNSSHINLTGFLSTLLSYDNGAFSGSWCSMWIVIWMKQGIRRNRFCFWWMIREQQHRMMRRGENEYLRTGGNRCTRSSYIRIGFHWMITEGYLVQSIIKSRLSRVTEPIQSKLHSSPLKEVNEGRYIHS